MKYTQNILKRIGRTIIKQNLLSGDDRILLALSGGKDSLVLLEALAEAKKNLPFNFEIAAIHILIDTIGYSSDIKYLQAFCDELSVPFYYRKFSIDLETESKKGICFVCAWHRRKAIFDAAKELQCNKIAFGHHMDDAVETLFMNMIYHGSISSMPYRLTMFDGRVQLIRPLLELTNDELEKYAVLRRFTREISACPHRNSKRMEMEMILKQANEVHKHARKNIFRSLSNIYPEYLPNYYK
jgi:tRNA 2-thiocytidine biosynthesis protein TtcA